MMSNYEVVVRIINMVLALVSIILLLRKAYLYWGGYQTRTKDYWWVLMCWSIVILFGTIEILLEWDTAFRVFFTLFAMCLTVKVLLRPNEIENPTFSKEL